MTDKRSSDIRNILNSLAIAVGVLLILAAVGVLVAQADFSEKQSAESVVSKLEAIIPARTRALPEPNLGRGMPSAEVGGEDFVGLLEIEQYGLKLPVASQASDSALSRFPGAFSGSIYERNLVVEGSNSRGQFDFVDEIEIGALVSFTDLYGRVFCYEVSMINHADSIESIVHGDDDLTLFAASSRTSKYVIIRCRLRNM